MKYFNHIALSLLLLRLLVTGASIGDALALIGLSSLLGYQFFLESKKQPIPNKEITDRLLEVEEKLTIISNKVNVSILKK